MTHQVPKPEPAQAQLIIADSLLCVLLRVDSKVASLDTFAREDCADKLRHVGVAPARDFEVWQDALEDVRHGGVFEEAERNVRG